METGLNTQVFAQVFDAIPVGLFLIGPDRCIYAWNAWMVKNTTIESTIAIGKKFSSLYPQNISLRFNWALEQVLDYGNPQVLSSILNKFIIPVALAKPSYLDIDMMQQNVEILPVTHNNKNMALVVVQDVSDKTHLKNTLMSMATKFEKESLIDALTGIYNRRFLWQHLDNELKTAQRDEFNVICCIYDLDYFKKINDVYGHEAGDDVLISFVDIAKSLLRPNDKFFRYGGEEFVIISTHIALENAGILPNRLRGTLQATQKHGRVKEVITCSAGISYWLPSTPLKSSKKLLEEADIELYKAKNNGRNCIFMDNEPTLNRR